MKNAIILLAIKIFTCIIFSGFPGHPARVTSSVLQGIRLYVEEADNSANTFSKIRYSNLITGEIIAFFKGFLIQLRPL
ncbi:MAG: hypothetical protein NTV01_07870, partial [Bacteroidia bacterium]|nr:hypothetical protein [Bacteroidia bacterium]